MRAEENLNRGQPPQKRPRKAVARAVAFLGVGVAAAVGAAFLLTRYMDSRTAAARVPTIKVVVAAVDVPVATPLKAEWTAVVDWPAASAPEGYFGDPSAILDRVTLAPLTKNEAILASKLAESGAGGGLATLLPDGTRAVAVRVDDVVGVAGFIHPADRVDVIVTMKPRDEAPETSKIILQNIKVLAVGKDVQTNARGGEKTMPATVATLQVTPEQSEALALAAARGRLLLALRGITDDAPADTTGAIPQVLFAGTAKYAPPQPQVARATRAPAARPAVAEPKPPEKQVVEILRGDLFEKRDFPKGGTR